MLLSVFKIWMKSSFEGNETKWSHIGVINRCKTLKTTPIYKCEAAQEIKGLSI